MKLLITGSSGYVGYVLARYFSEKGVDVVGIDVQENRAWGGNERYVFYFCDITDKWKLKEIFEKEQPTHVIHCAFLMNPIHDVKREYEIDVNGSVYAIEAANTTSSVKQFIVFSSTSAYGGWQNNPLLIKEGRELRPRDYRYGIHKKAVEEHCNTMKKRSDMKVVILRMCTATGPSYHKKGGVVALLANARLLPWINGRYCELQFIHEKDLTALLEMIVKDDKVDGVFNLAPDSYATTKELAPQALFVPVPLFLVRGIVRVLWWMRLVDIMPSAMTLSTYGIVAEPRKLMERYNYKFAYSTLEAFRETVRERRERGTL